ncbi:MULTISPECIES: SDR family NAD(P)-dependent oxidoreductase [unclassified Adlercreutzia]|uniref:SDR family NAD(P)-dependent oxidoreductase n=1 Tax=unclassified Adlercreutzia TaxID=2636013 RepID=UPI0013ED8CA6|nr:MULTISPECIES: SDR family oxidoreductase [unclassified Adlercreutzia]
MIEILKKVKDVLAKQPVYANVNVLSADARLQGRSALVTGATSGIGLAIVERFSDEGAVVHVTGRNASKLAELGERGFVAHQLDVRDRAAIARVMEDAFSLDPPSILVNSAGVYRYASFLDCSEEKWDEVLDSNLKGTFFVTQEFCRRAIERKIEASVINIASNTGLMGAWSCYAASKHGICGLTEGLGKELLGKGVTVNAIAPGPVATPINGRSSESELGYPPASDERMAVVEEIADLSVWLVSSAARHMTGQVIALDGGESCSLMRC